jgi:hypothetical protein
MHLHARLGDADIAGNLFAEATAHDLNHDRALPGGIEALLERAQGLLILPPRTIASKAELNGVEECLIMERFGEEFDGKR